MAEPLRYGMTLPNGQPLRWNMGPQFVWGGNVPNNLYPPYVMSDNNRLSITISDADKAAILAAIQTIRTKLPFLLTLSDSERGELLKLGDKSKGYDAKCAAYMASHPQFIPHGVDAAETAKDRAALIPMMEIYSAYFPLGRDIESTMMIFGHEIMVANNGYYQSVKLSAKMHMPEAEPIYNDLKERYPGRGGGPSAPPAPPTP